MLRTLLALSFAALALPTSAQQYPAGPVRILVGFAAGSGPDLQARTIAQQLATDLKQSFFIENRLGANGTIAARAVATAALDGLTLLFSSSSIAPTPHICRNLGYDTLTDLRPVATSGILDGLLVLVEANSPFKNMADLIAAASGRVLYGSPGVGNALHLAPEVRAEGRHHAPARPLQGRVGCRHRSAAACR
jgi:tripartite-type tricarboxylate transporter receptor subunit TctC